PIVTSKLKKKSQNGQIKYFKEHDGNMANLIISSDGNGSLPKFDTSGNLIGFGIASPKTVHQQVVNAVKNHGLTLEEVLPLVTRNIANVVNHDSNSPRRC